MSSPNAAVLGNGHLLALAPNGKVYQFNPATISLVAALQEHHGDPHATARTISVHFNVGLDQVEHDLHTVIHELAQAGLTPQALLDFASQQEENPPPTTVPEAINAPMALSATTARGVMATAAGVVVGGAVRLMLQTMPFPRWKALLRWIATTTRQQATSAEVHTALSTVDAGAAWLPTRVACLERSMAAFLILALRRRGVTWRVGARTPPLALHAWLADADGPIGEPDSTATFKPLITIHPKH